MNAGTGPRVAAGIYHVASSLLLCPQKNIFKANYMKKSGMALTALRVTSRNESPPYVVTGFSAVTFS